MKILIVAHFSQMPEEKGNNRFRYIADLLAQNKENEVELITSSFSHKLKKQRNLNDEAIQKLNYKITNIYEPGYKKNVSLKRFFSHFIMSKYLKKYLNRLSYKPDVIYCAVPSLDVAKVTAKYAKNKNIRFIIDVQDLWPEAFKMVFNIPIVSDIIFYPMKRKANYIYSHADEIIAVSETYVNTALKVNKNIKKGLSVFLGTDLYFFDKCKEENRIKYNDGIIRIVYIGTLGHSYDIKCVIDSLKILNDKSYNNIKFIIMGDGPLRNEFERYAKERNISYEFTGMLQYEKMVGILCSCDIAVNPIVNKSVASIINKVGDYAAAGIPVINTQNSNEYKSILELYNAGINCDNNKLSLASNIEKLINDQELRVNMGEKNRILAEDKFDREKTYKNIINIINNQRGR